MSTTTDQGLILPDLSDNDNVPLSFGDYNAGVESRLVKRYASTTDRTARNPTPVEGEFSYLIDANRFEFYSGTAWSLADRKRRFVLSSNQTNATSTPQVISDFTMALEANKAYLIDSCILYQGPDGNNVGEIQWRFNQPSGSRLDWGVHNAAWYIASGQHGDGTWQGFNNETASPSGFGLLGTSNAVQLGIIRGMVTNGANSGDLVATFCENVVSGTVTVYAKSWITLEEA